MDPMTRMFCSAVLFLTAMIIGYVSMASQVVPLPSTVFGCMSANGRLWASSPGALLVSDSGSLVLRRIPYPPGVRQAQNVRGTMLPQLSRSGRYVYQAFNGADGLYRYDLTTGTWSVIRPPSASRAVSALCVTQDDRIVIGCGGDLSWITPAEARDLFISSDFGSTWDTLGLPMGDRFHYKPSVLTIVESGSSLIIRTKQFQETAFSGVFERRNGGWKCLYNGSNADELLSVGASSYFSRSGALYRFHPGQDSLPRYLPNLGNVSWMQRWSGDTVVARTKLPGQDTISFILIDGASIVRTIPSDVIPPRYQSMAVLSWGGSPLMAYMRDGISALINPETGVSLPVTIDLSAPMIGSMIEDSGRLWCAELTHGLYQVDTSSVRRISEVNVGALNSIAPMFTTRGTYWQYGAAIVRIAGGVDTLLKPGSLGTISAMEFMEDGTLLVATNKGFSVVDLATNSIGPFTMNGWPKYVQNGAEQYCGVGCIARFGSRLYAFATRPERSIGDEAVGGLFRLDDTTWTRCDDSLFGNSTAIQICRRTSTSLVISTVSGMVGSTFVGGKLVRYDMAKESAALIADDELTAYRNVVQVAADDSVVLWAADDSLWFQRNTSTAERIGGLPPIGAAAIVGSHVFLWFRDSSVVRFPLNHFISSTSVSSDDAQSPPALFAAPSVVSSGDDVRLSAGGRILRPSSVDLVSMDGAVVPIPVVRSADGSTFTFQVPHVAPGMYLVVVKDVMAGYRTGVKLFVR